MKLQEFADIILFYIMRWKSLGYSHPGMLPQKKADLIDMMIYVCLKNSKTL